MIHGTMNIAPLTVNFTDTSSGDELKFLWNFGDGQTSALRNPTHTFSQGVWNVILTVTNDNGSDDTSATIVALPPSGGQGGQNGGQNGGQGGQNGGQGGQNGGQGGGGDKDLPLL